MNLHNFEYFIVLLSCLSVPLLLFLFHPRFPLKKNYKEVFVTIPVIALPWISWDFWATYRGYWSFNSAYTTGFLVFNLPIEEVMFFLIIPFCCLCVWSIVRDFSSWKKFYMDLLLK